MELKKLHNKLYRKNDELKNREKSEDRFDPEKSNSSGAFMTSKGYDYDDVAVDEKKSFKKRNKTIGIIILIVASISLISLATFFIISYIQNSYKDERVIFRIEGSEVVDSGDQIEYKIIIFNNNRADLENAVLDIDYSKEMKFDNSENWEEKGYNKNKINLGNIESKETKEIPIVFSVFGSKDARIYLNAFLEYKPKTVSSRFQKESQASSLIKASLLQVEILPFKEIASGEATKLGVLVKNKSDLSFENIGIEVNYPEEFIFKNATLEPFDKTNRKWIIEKINPAEQQMIEINGELVGQVGTVVVFSVFAGQYDEENQFFKYSESRNSSKIIPARVEVTQIARVFNEEISEEKGSVGSGETISFEIKFKNNSKDLLRDLVLKSKIDSRVIREETIKSRGSYYDAEKNEIIWKASTFPSLSLLEPNEEAEAFFSVELQDKFPVDSEEDKNFIIKTQASIESLDVNSPIFENKRIYSNENIIKVDSRFIATLEGKYNDPELPNEGPFPVEVGQKTTFTPKILIQNTSNDIENVVFSASFPPGITWEKDFLPDNADVQFNEMANKLTWKVGTVKAGTGFYLPINFLAFKIGVIPSENQLSFGGINNLILMKDVKIVGRDSFTGKLIEKTFQDLRLSSFSD